MIDHDVRLAAKQLRGTDHLVATVMRVQGSSYRRPGARMLTTRERRIAGSVSGGCLDGKLARTGWWRTADGPAVVTFDATDPDDHDAVLGCGGIVDILVERGGGPNDAIAFAERTLASGRRGAVATVFASGALPIGTRWLIDDRSDALCDLPDAIAAACARTIASGKSEVLAGEHATLVEAIVPPLALFVFGTGFDAVAVVESAARLGWSVTVVSAAARFETAARFPHARVVDRTAAPAALAAADRAVAVVMGHDRRRDGEAIELLLASPVRYIGVLGPRHRTDSLASPAALSDPRVHAPIGLDLGAETPEEIALSVVAEILAYDRRATAASLRGCTAIHR